jgi:hypothetical protein
MTQPTTQPIANRHSRRLPSPRRSLRWGSALLLVWLASLGCGFHGDLMDACQIERRESDAAQRLRSALGQQNVSKTSFMYDSVVERARDAQETLRRCESRLAETG